ncbi:Sua5/YciO/YrdC/YwlC family protein [Luteimonas sp. MC1572]|uniref:L-threonylcarbamoyladenylate synthase n=1 Tax=Luteimonas sp. MC1572 TaxID=2799325 RepID=UPI0018F0D84F|nr:Sua5/YciO/YrdC/YwlC family protein [Luteimonas sp. MC1572]MBJ6981702.1 Sua5/YciO/YrdC/YwlC family protein [Luteimonas sp. MC1572]QQO04637.1 Sua5/YciO/YrdC/YwlC family protein [Luteimonas sp. MC1572]
MPSPPDTDLALAVATVRRGGVIACPTEAVWGLGCDPFDEAAVSRLLAIKHRDVAKGLILVASDPGQLDGLVDWDALPAANRAAVLASWPGPNTWVLPALPAVPRWITGDHDTVAVRVSAHPLLAALCRGVGRPLVSTSANAAGEPPARTLAELAPALLEAVDAVLPGDTGGLERPTTIRDARSGAALRD